MSCYVFNLKIESKNPMFEFVINMYQLSNSMLHYHKYCEINCILMSVICMLSLVSEIYFELIRVLIFCNVFIMFLVFVFGLCFLCYNLCSIILTALFLYALPFLNTFIYWFQQVLEIFCITFWWWSYVHKLINLIKNCLYTRIRKAASIYFFSFSFFSIWIGLSRHSHF